MENQSYNLDESGFKDAVTSTVILTPAAPLAAFDMKNTYYWSYSKHINYLRYLFK